MEPEKEGHERARNRKTSLFQLICLFPLNRPFFRLPPFIPLDFAFSLGQLLLQHCKVSLCVCNVSRLFFYCFTTCFWIYNFWVCSSDKNLVTFEVYLEKSIIWQYSRLPCFAWCRWLLYINMRQECLQIW